MIQKAVTKLTGGLRMRSKSDNAASTDVTKSVWSRNVNSLELFAEYGGSGLISYERDQVAAYMRGYATPSGMAKSIPQKAILADIVNSYLSRNAFQPDALEGSFTLTLLDSRNGKILIYRNLGDASFTYYCQTSAGIFFSNNLVTLLAVSQLTPSVNSALLPAFFLYRTVPGRQTLFEGVKRVRPGELISIDSNCVSAQFLQTLASLCGTTELSHDAVDAVESTAELILRDCAEVDPTAAVLLSGGVDSSFIQVHWNHAVATDGKRARSIAIVTDHATGRLEQEYAQTASRLLATRHMEVAADKPYAQYLVRAIAATGEPPNHVQTAYFSPLAQAMVDSGIGTGLCGQAADALFGSPWGDLIHRARRLRSFLPSTQVRNGVKSLSDFLNKPYWSQACRLSNSLENIYDHEHPINQHDTFGDASAVQSCFGQEALAEACAYRLHLLEECGVRDDLLYQVNEIAFLADSYDTCALWTGLFELSGARLLFPFLDTRMLRVIANISPEYRFAYRQPKRVLKSALCRHMPQEFVMRRKLAFAQPIYEWLAPGGQLYPFVERIDTYDFIDPKTLQHAKAKPNSFLYCLLCYDLWHKLLVRGLTESDIIENCCTTA